MGGGKGCHDTDAAAPKHMARWSHNVKPCSVKERGVVGRVAYRPLLIGVQEVVPKDV